MKFELNDFHHNLSDEELLADLIRVSKQNNNSYISRSMYVKEGKFSAQPFISRWGTWLGALKAANLTLERTKEDLIRIDDKSLINDIRKVAKLLSKESITTKEYSNYGQYRVQTVLSRFGSWNDALKFSELLETEYKVITDEDLFVEIERLWQKKGSQPTTTDIRNGNSKYSLNTYSRHFGGWRNALYAFIKHVEDDKTIDDYYGSTDIKNNNNFIQETVKNKVVPRRRTSREINYKLRYKVLKRDNFKCCMCGASPAKDPSVVLHIDHIIPWSKGGETTFNNLQTLCSKCNLGKSDLL